MKETLTKIAGTHVFKNYMDNLENSIEKALDDLDNHITNLNIKVENVVELLKEVTKLREQLEGIEKEIEKRFDTIENLPAYCLDKKDDRGEEINFEIIENVINSEEKVLKTIMDKQIKIKEEGEKDENMEKMKKIRGWEKKMKKG